MRTEDEQWVKLFRYLDRRFAVVNDQFASVWQRFDKVDIVLDGILKRLDDAEIEWAASKSQLTRHEGRINQLTTKTQTKLK